MRIVAAVMLALAVTVVPAHAAAPPTAVTVVPAHAAPPPTAVATFALTFVPGGRDEPVPLTVAAGGSLELVNVDPLGWHAIESVDEIDGVPLFASDLIGMGTSTAVRGIDRLAPGVYSFFCRVHAPGMEGSLTVSPA